VSQSDPHSHADPHPDPETPPNPELTGPELTPIETFFDTLFNQHMVLPQPPADAAPIEGVDEHGKDAP
jgi:hypothetical protein